MSENGGPVTRRGHLAAYTLLTLFCLVGWREVGRIRLILYLAEFGAIMEVMQFFIIGRTFRLDDIGINWMGTGLGLTVWGCVVAVQKATDRTW